MVLKGLIFYKFSPEGCGVLKGLILTVFTSKGCDGLERTDFLYIFPRGVWWSWKDRYLNIVTLVVCSGLESTDFQQFSL